jgi:hypothetical protein
MKRHRLLPYRQIYTLLFLTVASLCSFAYLTHASQDLEQTGQGRVGSELFEDHSEVQPHKVLPDLELLRNIWEFGKQFMPAN